MFKNEYQRLRYAYKDRAKQEDPLVTKCVPRMEYLPLSASKTGLEECSQSRRPSPSGETKRYLTLTGTIFRRNSRTGHKVSLVIYVPNLPWFLPLSTSSFHYG
jgi:hypothetical protein